MQEEIENRTVTLIISAVKLTARELKAGMDKYLSEKKSKAMEKARAAPEKPSGKQTVRQLIGQNQGVSNIEITNSNIKGFERIARKYGVDFAVKKDRSVSPPKYFVFFKARDADALTAAFKEYTAYELKRAAKAQNRPSVLAHLQALKAKVQASLIPIGFDDIHAELKDFLSKQLPIWTNTGEIQPEGMGFCEFNGDSFLVLPPNASYGNSTIQAKNPLIILVEEPVKTLKVSSFLLPMSSSGNIVFKNEDVLRSVLNESPLMEKISSIDSFTEGALKYAQLFKQESFYYFAACALCLVSMGAAGIMSAQLWIGENRKRIFTLHTAGIKYSAIILPVLRKEVIVAVCTVLVGGIVVYSIRHPEPLLLLLSSAVLFLMYVLLNFVGYIFFSKREFLQMSFRRE